MSRYIDDSYEHPVRVKHIPLAPPRPGTPGEGIYLKLWQEFAEARPIEWRWIFHDTFGPVRQRAASVAASFMVWMGCNCGRSFTRMAEDMDLKYHPHNAGAYLAAWAITNQRTMGINSGLRAAEVMLAAEHPIEGDGFRRGINFRKVPAISQDDYDTIESMVRWWSTPAAKSLRFVAEKMHEAAQKKQQDDYFSKETRR